MGALAIARNAPVLNDKTRPRQDITAEKQQKPQTGPDNFYAGIFHGISNPGFAMPLSGTDFSQVPVRPVKHSAYSIQRCAKDGSSCSCPACAEAAETQGADEGNEEAALQQSLPAEQSIETEPVVEHGPAEEMSTNNSAIESPGSVSQEQPITGLIEEDSSTELPEGHIKKTDFLRQLRSAICRAINLYWPALDKPLMDVLI